MDSDWLLAGKAARTVRVKTPGTKTAMKHGVRRRDCGPGYSFRSQQVREICAVLPRQRTYRRIPIASEQLAANS